MPSSQASNLKMKTAGFYETLVSINKSTGSHIPQDILTDTRTCNVTQKSASGKL